MDNKVIIITPPGTSHRTKEENLGIKYLKAVLETAEKNIDIIDAWHEGISIDSLVERIISSNPMAVGVSAYLTSIEEIKKIVQLVKKKSNVIPLFFAGGFGPTFHPKQFLLSGIEYVFIGESEPNILKFIDLIKLTNNEFSIKTKDKLPAGLVYLDDGRIKRTGKPLPVTDLDSLPTPARSDNYFNELNCNPMHISTSRGCNAFCRFCSIASFAHTMADYANTKWRMRSIESIVAEIKKFNIELGVRYFKFVDDSFIEPPRDENWCEQLSKVMNNEGLKISFRTQVRADRITEPIAKYLSRAGWKATSIGIESGSNSALIRMGKKARVKDNIRILKILERYNIYTVINMILFDHKTTLTELTETLSFLKTNSWAITKGLYSEMFAAEGTIFTKHLQKNGHLKNDKKYMNYTYTNENLEVVEVQRQVKLWHSYFEMIYNNVVNPISAPKVISKDGYKKFHTLARKLYRNDIEYFEELLRKSLTNKLEYNFTDEKIRKDILLREIKKESQELYKLYKLPTIINKNKFI